MFNEANKKQVLDMQEKCYSDRLGKVYGDFEVTRVWYDWGTHRQMWELTCQKCGRVKITHNGKDYAKGKNKGLCGCDARAQKEAKEREKSERAEQAPSNSKWIGQQIGGWTIIGYTSGKGWLTRCAFCGKECYHTPQQLLRENPAKCTCQIGWGKYNIEKWRGQKVGHLTVLDIENWKFVCRCDCGRITKVIPTNLERGTVKSCGNSDCIHHKSAISTHGLSNDRIYRIWRGMKERCYNPKSVAWKTYGGRGIDICDEWKDDIFAFRSWALSHGYADNLSIDRIDNDKGYSPDNCRWADSKTQANNQHPKTPSRRGQRESRSINGRLSGL